MLIPAGEFMMGSTAEEQAQAVRGGLPKKTADRENPRHRVSIGKAFAAGRFGVMRGQYG